MAELSVPAKAGQKREDVGANLSSRDKALLCAREALQDKALDLVVLEISRFSSVADYFIICSGKSSRQVQGIADNLERGLRTGGIKPLGSEGKQEGHWVLIDYGDVVIHIFYEPVRLFYDLESLWSEAPRVEVDWDHSEGAPGPDTV
ncbi:MAG: ribosome silencing factor [Syntrophobacteraceae bacterium]|nr:ribosome silencing factor [Syntrophobacteraceae bacterium]